MVRAVVIRVGPKFLGARSITPEDENSIHAFSPHVFKDIPLC